MVRDPSLDCWGGLHWKPKQSIRITDSDQKNSEREIIIYLLPQTHF